MEPLSENAKVSGPESDSVAVSDSVAKIPTLSQRMDRLEDIVLYLTDAAHDRICDQPDWWVPSSKYLEPPYVTPGHEGPMVDAPSTQPLVCQHPTHPHL